MSGTKTVTIKGAVYFDTDSIKYDWCEPYRFYSGPADAFSTYVPVMPHEFTVEVPADFDPRPGMVAALQEKKEKARAEFAALVVSIDRQINELLAIECEVSA